MGERGVTIGGVWDGAFSLSSACTAFPKPSVTTFLQGSRRAPEYVNFIEAQNFILVLK